MKITAAHTFAAPRDRVYAALTDPDVLRQVIPGCEKMVRLEEDRYEAHLRIGVAGLKGLYTGFVTMKDKAPPGAFTLAVDGKGGPGFVRGVARITLTEDGPRATTVGCDADVQVGGLIAALGSRLIEPNAKRMLGEFFASFERHITTDV